MTSMPDKRAQSAMEYLMTYGWAILIIAVVLAVLFALGLFNGNNIVTNSCIASPGFLCTGASYSHSNANITVTLGQSTGISWVAVNFTFVPQGTPTNAGIPMISFNSLPSNTILTTDGQGLPNDGEQLIVLPANSITPPVVVGTPIEGTIWAYYTYYTSSQGIQQKNTGYAQMAVVKLKAS